MTVQTSKMLDANFELFSADIMADTVPHGDSVRLRKLNTPGYMIPPTSSFLVYVKFEGDALTVRHMYTETLVNNSIGDTEDALFAKAKAGPGAPEQIGKDFETMLFRRPTYFTIVLDNPGWDFYYPDPTDPQPVAGEYHDPIIFIPMKAVLIEQPGQRPIRRQNNYAINKSFYNLEPRAVGGMKAIRCINFYRDEQGLPIDARDIRFDLGFEILVQAPFTLSPVLGRKLILVIDPDGQNQGPTV